VEFEAVTENTGWLGDDAQLDIDSDDSNKYNAYWTISSTPFIGTGTDSGGSYDAYLKVMMERAVAQKAKVIVINGTGEDGDYGLDTVSTGVYRYSADDQVYLVVLNVTGTSAHFQSGMNTIILPRAIALQCQLNDTLYNLQNVGSSPLNGASFYSTDPLKTTASGHIIAVISKNVTASQAETILTTLTHNATGGRIGNNATISSTALYLLHLPNDILSAIPTSVMNSGMGEGPNYYSLGSVIGDIAGMVFDFLVWVATGGVLLLLAHLVKEGLMAISNLVSTAITAVEAAVDRIVDAFCAMVDWVIDLITSTLTTVFDPLISSVTKAINSYLNGLNSAMVVIQSDIENAGSILATGASSFVNALNGNLYWILFGIAIVFYAIILAISAITNVFSFIIGMIASLAAMYFIEQMLSSEYIGGGSFNINIDGLTADYVHNFALDAGAGPQTPEQEQSQEGLDWSAGLTMFGFLFGFVAAQATMLSIAIVGLSNIGLYGLCSFAAGVLGVIIGTSTIFGGPLKSLAGFIGLELGLFSVGEGILDVLTGTETTMAKKVFDTLAILTGFCSIGCSVESLYIGG